MSIPDASDLWRRSIKSAAVLALLLTTSAVETSGQGRDASGSGLSRSQPPVPKEAPSPPNVCFDSGHFTYHSLDGAYAGLGHLLEGRGLTVEGVDERLSVESLSSCQVLVIANPLTERLARVPQDWSAPYEPAFTREEIRGLFDWIESGGGLLLVVDHNPVPGAARDLLELLGALPINGHTWLSDPGEKRPPEHVFERTAWWTPWKNDGGTLRPHPITLGSRSEEPIQSVKTYGGSPFYPSTEIEPLLVFPEESIGMINFRRTFEDDPLTDGWWARPNSAWPRFPIGGWLQAGARRLGAGRVVILGEAAMCTAYEGRPSGLNESVHQNAQFCFNAVRWLAGQLPE